MRRSRPRLAWFEIRPLAGKGTTLLIALALAGAIAGCGGGGGSGDETAARKQLEAGGRKLTDADSFEVSLLFELEEESEPEEVGCIDLGVDSRKPVSIDMRTYDLNCSGGSEAHEVIAIGNRAWASGSDAPGSWTEARIAAAVTRELDDEQTTDLQQLFEAAEHIEAYSGGGAVLEGKSHYVDVPSYSFDAPASTFPDAEDLGDAKIDFEAILDRKGFLRELKLHGDEDGTGVTLTETYEDIDADLGIRPPDRSAVYGAVQQIRSREDLDALLGASP